MRTFLQCGILALSTMVALPVWADEAPAKNPDPWEHVNRQIFRFNDAADRYAIKPAAKAYIRATPNFVRTGIGNFFDNLNTPLTAVNQVLQGKLKLAAEDTGRFLVNTTVGVLGLFDVASKFSLSQHKEDFGQTLGVWGVGPGPYLVLPFAGPSTVRDLGGQGVDIFLNPKNYYIKYKTSLGLYVAESFNHRAELIPVEGIIQGDRYLFIRDLYLQKREYDIKDGKVEDEFLNDEDTDNSSGASGGSQGVAAPASPAGGSTPLPAQPEQPQKTAPSTDKGGSDKSSDPFLDSAPPESPSAQPADESSGKDGKPTP